MTNYGVSHNTENYIFQKCPVTISNLADGFDYLGTCSVTCILYWFATFS